MGLILHVVRANGGAGEFELSAGDVFVSAPGDMVSVSEISGLEDITVRDGRIVLVFAEGEIVLEGLPADFVRALADRFDTIETGAIGEPGNTVPDMLLGRILGWSQPDAPRTSLLSFAGTSVEDTGTGAEPALSFETRTATPEVEPDAPNEAPSGRNSVLSIDEDTAYSFSPADFGFSDPDPADTLVAVRFDILPSTGTLLLDGVAVASAQIVTFSDLSKLTFVPAANENGADYATIAFSVQDSAGTFALTANTISISVTAVNDAPEAVDDAFSGTEGAQIAGNVLTGNGGNPDSDVEGDALTVTAGTFTTSQGGSVTLLSDGSFTYTPATDFNGTDSFDYTVSDGTATDTGTVTLTVASVNDLPNTLSVLASANEDATSVDLALVGVDSDGSVRFFRIETLPANGTLYADAGRTQVLAVGDTVEAIADQATVYFVPAPNTNGQTSFTYVAIDDADGADASPATVVINIAPVNDAPVLTGDLAATVSEGGSQVLTSADLGYSDPDDGDTDVTFTVSNLINGTITVNGVAATSFTGTQLVAGQVAFVHDGSETSTASFSVSIEDGNEDGSTPAAQTFNLTVTPVNDAPILTGDLAATVAEGGSQVLGASDLGYADPDDGDTDVTFTVSNLVNGTITVNGVATTSFTGAQLVAGQVAFVHDGSETSTASFSVSVEDGNEDRSTPVAQTFNLTVTPINDAPVLTGDLAATVAEGGSQVLGAGDLGYSDPDDGDADVTFTVSNLVNGTITVNGVAATSFTGTQLASGQVAFVHDGSETVSASFDVLVEDGNEDSSTPVAQTFSLTVTPVNDAPILTGDLTTTVAEGGSQVLGAGDLGYSDPDDGDADVTFTVSNLVNGTITVNGVAATSFTGTQLAAGQVAFVHDGSDANSASFSVSVEDGNEDGSTPVAQTFNLTVTPVNDAPVLTGDLAATVAEGGSQVLTANDLGYSDPDDGDADVTFTVSNLVNGTITVNGVATTSFTGAQLVAGQVAFVHDGSETVSASFDVLVEDGNEDGSTPVAQTFNLTVSAINDAPVLTGDLAATVSEGGSQALTSADLGYADPDDGDTDVTFTVSNLVNGMITVNGVAATSFTGAQLVAGQVAFAHDGSETNAASFSVSVEDGNEDGSTPVAQTFNLTVTPVNDAPVLTGDLAATVAEGGSQMLGASDLGYADPDDGDADVTFTISNLVNGTITINGVAATSFTGAQLVAGQVAFAHDGSETSTASFSVSVEDGNEDGSTPVAQTFILTVTAVNDAPVLTGDLAATVFEGGSQVLTSADLGYADPDDGDADVTFTVSNLVNGTITVNGVAATSFTGTQLAAGQVAFVHDGSETVSASFDVLVEDGNEDNSTPVAQTFSLAVTSVNDAPILTGDLAATVAEGGSQVLGASDLGYSDPDDGDADVTFSVSSLVNGTITVNGVAATSFTGAQLVAGQVALVHDGSETVSASFDVLVEDGNEDVSTPVAQTFNLTVSPVNDAPVAADDAFSGSEDHAISGNLLADNGAGADFDVDGDTLTVVAGIFATAQGGSVTIEANGSFVYTPAADFSGADSFQYTLSDGSMSDTGTVTLSIGSVNDMPVISSLGTPTNVTEASSASAQDIPAQTGSLTVSDADLGDTLTASVSGSPVVSWSGGSLTSAQQSYLLSALGSGKLTFGAAVTATGSSQSLGWSWDPTAADLDFLAAGQTLTITYQVAVSDGNLTTASQPLSFTIVGTNDAPVAVIDTGSITEDDEPKTFNVLANDTLDKDAGASNSVSVSSITVGTNSYELTASDVQVTVTADNQLSVSLVGTKWDSLWNGESLLLKIYYKLAGNSGEYATNRLTLSVHGLNDAPVLDASANLSISVLEDATLPAQGTGTLVSDLVDQVSGGGHDNVTDDSFITGIAITGADTDNGTWYFSTDDGASWKVLGSVSDSHALTLLPTARLAFVPDAGYNGTITDGLTIHAWDGTGGANGSYWDATVNGGTTGYSVATDTVSVNVGAVNDAPVLTGDLAATVAEGGSQVLTSADLGYTDPDDGDAGVTFTVSNLVNGTITVNGVAATSFTGTQLVAGQVAFVHDGSETSTASFSVSVEDGNEDGSTPVARTFNLTVTPVNDAPVLTGDLAATVSEGGSQALTSADLGYSDPDDGDADVTFTVSNLVNGTITVNGVAATSFTGAQLVAGQVAFAHDGSETVSASFDVLVEDGNEDNSTPVAQTFNLTVTPVNDAPDLTGDLAATVAEGGSQALTSADLGYSDPDDGDADVTFTVTNLVNGTITVNGVAATSFTGTQLAAGQVAFVHDGSETNSASFSVSVEDGNEDASTPAAQTFNLTVTPVNDPASISGVTTGSVTEDGTLTRSGTLTVTDPDAGENQVIAQTNTAGTYGTFSITAAGAWTYTLNNSAPEVQALNSGDVRTETFTVTSKDGTATQTVTITVNGADDNHAPMASAQLVSTNEDTAYSGTVSATDADSDPLSYALVANSVVGGSVTSFNATTGAFTFVPNPDFAGIASFQFTASDGSLTSAAATVTIDVAPVADGGTVTLGSSELTASGVVDVSDYTADNNKNDTEPKVTALADGQYVVTWWSNHDGDNDIFVRIFNADGSAASDEIKVSELTSNLGYNDAYSSVTATANGGFIVTWTGSHDGDWDTYIRVFNADGTPASAEINASDGATNNGITDITSSVTELANGNFVMTWKSTRDGYSAYYVKIFGSDGTALTSAIPASDIPSNNQVIEYTATVVALTGGGFVVTWDSAKDGDSDAYARVFAAGGTVLSGEINVSDGASDNNIGDQDASITALSNGGFIVAWTRLGGSNGDAYAKIFDASGNAVSGEINLIDHTTDGGAPDYKPSITALAGDGFVATWQSARDGDADIYARIYDSNGNPLGDEINVSDGASDNNYDDLAPRVVALDDGSFAIVWYSAHDGDQDIFARFYNMPRGTEDMDYAIALGASLTDGSESVTSIVLSGFPAGATFAFGHASGATWIIDNAGDIAAVLAAGDVTMTPPANYHGTFTLTASLTVTDTAVLTTGTATSSTTITETGDITFASVNDAASISGDTAGAVTEDGTLTQTGTLTVTDPDSGENQVVAQTNTAGTYGTFSISAAGAWTYTLDNSASAVQTLNSGDVRTETFTVASKDGTATQTVTITVNGAAEPVVEHSMYAYFGVGVYGIGLSSSYVVDGYTYEVDASVGDGAKISINGATNYMSFITPPDNYNHNDIGGVPGDGTYVFDVTGYDANGALVEVIHVSFDMPNLTPPVVSGAENDTFSSVPANWVWSPDNAHIYQYDGRNTTWTLANSAASNLISGTSYLATITSAAENTFADALVNLRAFLGASDSTTEGEWIWVTGPEAGTQFWSGTASGNAVGGEYVNWASGQPSTSSEDYLQLTPYGEWNDAFYNEVNIGYLAEAGAPGTLYAPITAASPFTFEFAWLQANDTNQSATLRSVSATSSLGATLSFNAATGEIVYDPTTSATLQALGAAGSATDTFTYTIYTGAGISTATVELTVQGNNHAPEIDGLADTIVFQKAGSDSLTAYLDPNLAVTDADSTDFKDGVLVISGLIAGEDAITFLGGAGNPFTITSTESILRYNSQPIGYVAFDEDQSQFVVVFSSGATAEGVTALLEHLQITNTAASPTLDRTVEITLTDGDGGVYHDTIDVQILGQGSALPSGTAGDDMFVLQNNAVSGIDGGLGHDTLALGGAGITLDFTLLSQTAVTSIEEVDLTGTGDNTLKIALADVLDMSDDTSGGVTTLTVTGNAGDTVQIADFGSWSQQTDVTADGDVFHVYTNNLGRLLVEDTVTVAAA